MKKFRFLLTASSLIVVLSLFACNKEDCQLVKRHKAELRIFNEDSVNVTSK